MIVKILAAGTAAVVAVAVAAAGLTSMSSSPPAPRVQPVVFDVPLPLAPATALPTADQLSNVLYRLADPSVPFANKSGLVEGGIGPMEARLADHQLQKAAKKGQLPLSFTVSDIAPAGPGAATADVAVSGPKITAPVTEHVTFVDQGGWMLSRGSAMSLLQAASAA